MHKLILTTFCILVYSLLQGQDNTKVTIYNAKDHLGKDVTICDKVIDIFRPSGENKPIYINFGAKYPDQSFTAVIFAKDLQSFLYDPVEGLKDKDVCITGKIVEYKGKPQMVLNVPTQVLIQE